MPDAWSGCRNENKWSANPCLIALETIVISIKPPKNTLNYFESFKHSLTTLACSPNSDPDEIGLHTASTAVQADNAD